MMRDLIASSQDAKTALEALNGLGIQRFCMMPEFDARIESVSFFLLRREKFMQELRQILPTHMRLERAACVSLSNHVHKTPKLSKLCIPKTNYLPISLPLAPESDWLAVEINQLLYHSDLRLVFMNFDLYPIFYKEQFLQKLLALPHAAYQFNYKSLTNPLIRDYLKYLLQRNATVLFGTSVNSIGKASYYEFEYYIQTAHKYFSQYECDTLFYQRKIYRKPLVR